MCIIAIPKASTFATLQVEMYKEMYWKMYMEMYIEMYRKMYTEMVHGMETEWTLQDSRCFLRLQELLNLLAQCWHWRLPVP